MGGDEFAVIMPEIVEPEGAVQVASALIDSLVEPFELQQGTASISCSVGVALYPRHADTIEGLTQCSDMAMYAAKNAGKRRVQVWQGA
jgi:diguanylate cyclase (GGDEF)-like protein